MTVYSFLLSLIASVLVLSSSSAMAQETAADTAADTSSAEPVQSGPLIDLLGPKLLSLEMIDETSAQFVENLTSEALAGKKVIGLYFSADWWYVRDISNISDSFVLSRRSKETSSLIISIFFSLTAVHAESLHQS